MEDQLVRKEERLNAVSHGIGVCLSVYGLILLLQRSALFEDWLYTASNVVFGVSFCLLYVSSTLLHGVRSPKWGRRFERWTMRQSSSLLQVPTRLSYSLLGTVGYD